MREHQFNLENIDDRLRKQERKWSGLSDQNEESPVSLFFYCLKIGKLVDTISACEGERKDKPSGRDRTGLVETTSKI